MPLAAIGVIVVALLLAWAGVEVDHVMHAYPAQFYAGVLAVLFIGAAAGVARFRAIARSRVPVQQLARSLPLLPKAIAAVPVLTAIATAPGGEAGCERDGCARKTPMSASWGVQVEGEAAEHLFCSERCAQAWDAARRQEV